MKKQLAVLAAFMAMMAGQWLGMGAAYAADGPAAVPPPQVSGGVLGGTCVASSGSLMLYFSAPLSAVPSNPWVSLSGGMTCVGLPVTHTLQIGSWGPAITYSCEAGAATIVASVTLPGNSDTTEMALVQDGINVHVVLSGPHVHAVGDFVWSTPASIDGCATGHVTSTELTGSLTYTFT